MLTAISLENGKTPLLEDRTCECADKNGLLLSFQSEFMAALGTWFCFKSVTECCDAFLIQLCLFDENV